MLVIREEQLESMRQYMLDSFEQRMVAHLRRLCPDKDVEEPELRALIREGLERAEAYAIEDEPDVRRYLECMVLLGRAFDRDEKYPWAGRILGRNDLDGETKMDQIQEHMMFGVGEPV